MYALTFAVKTVGLDDTTMLWVVIAANLVALATIPLWANLADRIGRKPVFIFGALGSGAMMFAYLAAIAGGSYVLIFIVGIAMSGLVYSAQNGVWPALYGEMFPTRVRLSGMAIGTQIGFALGGLAPTVADWIAGDGTGGWVPVAALTFGASVLAAIAIATARETVHMSPGRDRWARPRRWPRAERGHVRWRSGRCSHQRNQLISTSTFSAFPLGSISTSNPSGTTRSKAILAVITVDTG